MNKSLFVQTIILSIFLLLPFSVWAQSSQEINELEEKIDEKTQERKELEEEADRLRQQLLEVTGQRQTISSELSLVSQERKELENSIAQTQNSIDTLELEITQAQYNIEQYESQIDHNSEVLARVLRSLHQEDQKLQDLEFFLESRRVHDIVFFYESLSRLQEPLIDLTHNLRENRVQALESTITLNEKQEDLSSQQDQLDDQRGIIGIQEQEIANILEEAQQEESSFQATLDRTLQVIQDLDQEIRSFESTLSFLLDPSSIPPKGSKVFVWPLDNVFITQRFGRTVSSERLYVSGSHSGLDFRSPVGTPIYAVADGTVVGVGDTDQTCARASFGKWVFIEHHSLGLSTTSAHLSVIKATPGQQVQAGDLIGYAGNTGRSTAPHLHLTVYATEGIDGGEGARITQLDSKACVGRTYTMPLAPTAAYLNPLDFFPATSPDMFKYPER